MIININLKHNFVNKLIYENCVIKKLHACSHRALIKRVIMFFELLHKNLMKLILKEKELSIVFNETLYVFILLNDVT